MQQHERKGWKLASDGARKVSGEVGIGVFWARPGGGRSATCQDKQFTPVWAIGKAAKLLSDSMVDRVPSSEHLGSGCLYVPTGRVVAVAQAARNCVAWARPRTAHCSSISSGR